MKILLASGVTIWLAQGAKAEWDAKELIIFTARHREIARFYSNCIAGWWYDNETVEVERLG